MSEGSFLSPSRHMCSSHSKNVLSNPCFLINLKVSSRSNMRYWPNTRSRKLDNGCSIKTQKRSSVDKGFITQQKDFAFNKNPEWTIYFRALRKKEMVMARARFSFENWKITWFDKFTKCPLNAEKLGWILLENYTKFDEDFFPCAGSKQATTSGQEEAILSTWVADQNTGFVSSCPRAQPVI